MRKACLAAAVLVLSGCGEGPSGFISIQATTFFAAGDSLTCGRLEIHPKPNGFLSGFYAVTPGPCQLELHAQSAYFGTSLCQLDVKENTITSVYLTRRGGALSCSVN